jgi:two-component system, OmpR family, response regulator
MTVRDRRIYVLEDQVDIARLVCRTLEEHGYRTEMFHRAADLHRRLRGSTPELCIVDLGLPDGDGLQVVRGLCGGGLPVIILTGRSGVTDRVLGLELGADDYVVKPFEPRELVARINAVLRRARPDPCTAEAQPAAELARFAGWVFDYDTHTLTAADGATTELSAAEARLLLTFLRAPNRILTREALLGIDRDDRAPFDRAIDVRVSRLRQKLEPDPKTPRIIKTVYGSGYLFATGVEWSARER